MDSNSEIDSRLNSPTPEKDDTSEDSIGRTTEELRKFIDELEARRKAQGETFDYTEDREQAWNEGRTFTAQELERLLLSEEFGRKVVEAILRTDRASEEDQRAFGTEYGLVVYDNLEEDHNFAHVSPLFQGKEKEINLQEQQFNYLVESDDEKLQFGANRSLVFHTHPNTFVDYLSRLALGESLAPISSDYFSARDLSNFKRIAERESPGLIYALGTKNRTGSDGSLLLVSFNNFEQYEKFNPEEVVKKSREFKARATGSPLQVYTDAGLNAAVIPVRLRNRSGVPFGPQSVRVASKILATRAA